MSTPPGDFSTPGPVPPARPRGWGKTVLVGCGAVAAILAIGFLGFILYMRRNPERMTDLMMRQVESNYASDVTPQEKEELRSAYAEFRKVLVSGHADSRWLADMRSTVLSAGPTSPVTREQVRSLTDIFRRGAVLTPSVAPTAAAIPGPARTP